MSETYGCNGTGQVEGQKAEVKGVLTEDEIAIICKYCDDHGHCEYEKRVYGDTHCDHTNMVEDILTARLTALQSAHDIKIKELEKKVIEAIPKKKIGIYFTAIENLEQHTYNEAVAKFTANIKSAFGGGK